MHKPKSSINNFLTTKHLMLIVETDRYLNLRHLGMAQPGISNMKPLEQLNRAEGFSPLG